MSAMIDAVRDIWSRAPMISSTSKSPASQPILAAFLLAALPLLPGFLLAEDQPAAGKQVEQALKVSDTLTVPYLLALPKDYGKEPGKK